MAVLVECLGFVLMLSVYGVLGAQHTTPDRLLASVTSVYDADSDGWVPGRATFSAPSQAYRDQFNRSDAFGQPGAGSCGYYNGGDRSNYSAVITPAIMRAAAARGNPDFPGSCGRCYEVQCVSGPVIANYSDVASTNTKLDLSLVDAMPPYQETFRNLPAGSRYPVSDNQAMFQGNTGEADDKLDVQCMPTSNSSNEAIIIQITDSCECVTVSTETSTAGKVLGVSKPCCTNVPHFNIDYHAFEKLAHPNYGWMNMRFRTVDCISKAPTRRDLQLPANVSTSILSDRIFSNQFELGWGLLNYAPTSEGQTAVASSVDQELQTTRLDRNGGPQNGSCFTFPFGEQYQVGMNIVCRACETPGYMPFALTNSSGIEFLIESAFPRPQDGFVDGALVGFDQVPHLTLSLKDNSSTGSDSCPAPVLLSNLSTALSATPGQTGFYQLRVLWQNHASLGFFSCVANLSNINGMGLAPENVINLPVASAVTLGLQVSFCLANITILPPTVDASGIWPLPPTFANSELYNCFYAYPQPVNQEGRYLSIWGEYPNGVNVSSTGSSSEPDDPNGFTAFSHTDLQNSSDLHAAAGGQCTQPGATNGQLVDDCVNSSPTRECCLDLNDAQLNSTSPGFPKILAGICNDIVTEGKQVCQAFTWDHQQNRGYFKGQPVNAMYDLDMLSSADNATMCNAPNVTTWILNAAWIKNGNNDTRALSLAVLDDNTPSSGSSWTKKVWSAVGAVVGVASPVVATVVFLLIFNSYRLEKKLLVKQVVKNLRAPDICAAANSAAAHSTVNPVPLASANYLVNSGQMLLGEGPISGIVPGYAAQRRVGSGDPSVYDPDDPSLAVQTAEDIKRVGREITLRCLQRWDGFLGFRASKDSLGRQSGIWRDKFDGVRIASMLLAFRRLNSSLGYNQPGNTGSLYKTWTQSNFKHQGILISELAKVLQTITAEEAQALPDKDPETIGFHDRLCGCWKACGQCCCRRK